MNWGVSEIFWVLGGKVLINKVDDSTKSRIFLEH